MTAQSSRNAIGPPRGRATIEVGIAVVGATFMPEEPDVIVMPAVAVSVVIVSATVITSIALSVFIVALSLSSVSSTCLLVDAVYAVSAVAVARRRRLLLSSWLLTCPLVAVVSAVAAVSAMSTFAVARGRVAVLVDALLCRSPLPRCRRINDPLLVVMPPVKHQVW